jgi:hypothetical protein
MTTNFFIYLQNRLIQTSQTGGQLYSDTSPFSIPWLNVPLDTPGSRRRGSRAPERLLASAGPSSSCLIDSDTATANINKGNKDEFVK